MTSIRITLLWKCPPPSSRLKWDSVPFSDGIVNVDEDDTKAEIRKKTKDALNTKLPLYGTDNVDVILMIRLLNVNVNVNGTPQAIHINHMAM